MTQVIQTIGEWKKIRNSDAIMDKKIGLVPTMGALHAGHESLLKKSINENDLTIASIFVNPTQFNDPTDLKNYPKTYVSDLELLVKNKVEYLFLPQYEELYPDDYSYRVSENQFSKILCGQYRPSHFDGVLTVVLKLLNIIKPHHIYFGEKDYQQFKLIEEMCNAFFLDVKVIPSATIREKDGLAMSSRNLLLTIEERFQAATFPNLLMSSKNDLEIRNELELLGFHVDYIQTINGRRFGAVHLGKVRLIDNVQL
jgi:pantoate--beta-alanine ligase